MSLKTTASLLVLFVQLCLVAGLRDERQMEGPDLQQRKSSKVNLGSTKVLRAKPGSMPEGATQTSRLESLRHMLHPSEDPYPGNSTMSFLTAYDPQLAEQLAPRRLRQESWRRALSEELSAKEILLAVGGGTGAGPTAAGDPDMDRDMVQRTRYQDQYYADPRVDDAVIDTSDVHDFLETFNRPPQNMQLQIQGLSPVRRMIPHIIDGVVEWKDAYYRYDFSYSLDLTPWVVPVSNRGEASGEHDANVAREDSQSVTAGLSEADVGIVGDFLRNNSNDLGTFSIEKQVEWPGWEELAINIKQKIRQGGYQGAVFVTWNSTETIIIYKNKPWANFLHMGLTRVIFGLSAIGYLWYWPYMWIRQRGPEVCSKFKVDIPIEEYWRLVGNKISGRGFEG
eukprot:TRINITY_DN13737_c0_g1_i1.p1 TRINITY_DN13737_c0_g1~~TRINITY_DN13737_c0_g1_i1.p1  ORF type:complete len:395 (-),score=50.50 TRINITY_DN13737_c0_g1_i1:93-1277(-)